MGVLWNKIWFDLWRSKTRTLLTVLSIAVGVFAMGAIFGMSDMMSSTMDASHRSVIPPHITVYLTEQVKPEVIEDLRAIPGVENVEPFNEVGVQYKIHPQDEWRQGLIHMRGDFVNQKYELVQLRQGPWPSGKDDLGVERMAAQFNKLGIGDSITFKIGNRERTETINALIRHPFVPPPQFFDLSVFFMSGAGLEHFDVPNGTYASFFVRVTPYSADYAKEVATAIKDRLAKQDIGVATFVYQDPDRHWGRAFMDGFNLVQQVLAVIAVLMGAVLVYNTLSNQITQQTNQIGILKAIGSRNNTIAGLFLVSTFVFGLLALILALPLGAAVAYFVARYFLDLFNIDFNTFQVSRMAVGLQVVAALVTPLLAGIIPISKGAAMTVRQAIASYGLGGSFGLSKLDRAVDRLGERWLPSHYATALGNMFRRKGRLLMTELVLVTAGASFLMVMGLNSSISLTMNNIYARSRYDSLIAFAQNERVEHVSTLIGGVSGVEAMELHLVQSASLLVEGQLVKEAGIGTSIEGIPAGSDFYTPLLVDGRWFLPGDGRAVVLKRQVAEDNHISVGDRVTLDLGDLGRDKWTVVGIYDPIFAGGFSSDTIYAPLGALQNATKRYNQGSWLYLRTTQHDAKSTDEVTKAVKNLLDDRGLKVAQSQTIPAQRATNDFQFGMVITMMLALSVIVALVGGIALMGALSIGVIERTKEIGVLRAIGARSRTILGIFIMEGVLQGLISWVIAVPISLLTTPLLARALGIAMFGATLDYQYNWGAVGMWLIFILLISMIASIMPANTATRISVRDSLAYA
ncbi:MAG TPA: FtsX-like permease family protein [Anaerolineales bacterium]